MKNSINGYDFNKEITNIAYSLLGLAPVNTAEHYYLASHLGFNAIKGDVRITKDEKLIMCHDPGVTIDADGKITGYNENNCFKFLDYELEYFNQFEHKSFADKIGYCAHLCDFETYIRICKETGKVAFITLRNNKIDRVVPEVLRVLKKYYMLDRCILNSMTFETLVEVRKHTSSIPVSFVHDAFKIPEENLVDDVLKLGNSILTFYFYLRDMYDNLFSRKLWEKAQDVVKYAKEKNLPMYMAIVDSYYDYTMLIQGGIQGFQLYTPFFHYQREDIQFSVTLHNGKADFGNILGSDRLVADISQNGSVVEIKNIRKNRKDYFFEDGLPALWLNTLPFRMDVHCSNNPKCKIEYNNNSILLDTNNVDGVYYINVNI
ncbi:MAG: hypothetical protein IKA17_09210 [Clostridia bacterium]|nr:hypothetical protein [Clostridia bacterium]